jgi:branched-chain amino acid transport system substrate-binding protein
LKRFFSPGHCAKGFVFLLILALILGAAACDQGEAAETDGTVRAAASRSPDTSFVIPAGEPVIVGVSAALTGPLGSLGLECRDSVVVGIERWKAANGSQIKGHDIQVYAEDDGGAEADIAVFAAERMLRREPVVGVIGPMTSTAAEAAIPVYAEAGIVMISGTATRTDLTLNQPEPKLFFRTAYTNAAQGILQARYVTTKLNATTAYIIDDSASYGKDLADAAQETLIESGLEEDSITREHIGAGAVDFSELAAQIVADDPDVVIFEGYNPEGALLYRQIRDAGYGGGFVSGDGVAVASEFIEPLGEQAEGAVFSGSIPDLPEEFLDDYIEIIGQAPTIPFAGHQADAVCILLDAVAQVAEEQADGSLVIDPLELRDAVSNPELLVGLSGTIAFDENGDRVGNAETVGLAMSEVKDGEFVLL